jgi:PAS domain S-box-containing protein
MINKISTSGKLYLLVVVMSVFITGIGLYGIREMKKMKQNTQTLNADRVLPLEQLTTIRYAYATGILVTTDELESHSINADAAKNKIENSEKIIEDNWQAYLKTYLTPEEQQLVQLAIPLKQQADKAVVELKQKIEDVRFSNSVIDVKTYATIDPFISKLNELVQLQINVSSQLNEDNDQLYNSTAIKFYWLIAVSLLFAGALGFFIINDNKGLINDLKISNRKIKEEEEKSRAFIKYAGDAIFILDEDLGIVNVNDSGINLLGYLKEELLKMKMPDILAPEEQVSHPAQLDIVKKDGGSQHERKFKRKDGSIVETEINVRILEAVGYIAIIRDITSRKESEAIIKERESQLTAFFENVEGAAALLDTEKKYLLFNSRFIYDHHILTKQDPYVGQVVYDLFPEGIQKPRLKMLDNVLKGNKEVVEVDYMRDGQRICYRTSFNPVITNGKVTGISTFSIDLSKSKEAEMKLRQSEEKFRMSFMTSPDAFFISTLNTGLIIDVNDGFCNVFGYTKEEAIGKSTLDLNLYANPEDRLPLIDKMKTNKYVKDIELTVRKKNGELIFVSLTGNIFEMNNEQVNMWVVRDITERKKTESDLHKINYDIGERVKELNCLYNISDLSNDPDKTIEDILKAAVDIIPLSYQYPEITCARIVFNGQIFESVNFMESVWRQEADIVNKNSIAGKIVVFYKEQMKEEEEGPFLREERLLINSIVDILGSSAERKYAETELRESEEKFRSFVEETLVGVFILQDEQIVYANPGFENISGYTLQELSGGMNFQQLVYKEDVSWVKENYELRMSGEKPSDEYLLRAVKKEGTIIYVDILVSRIIYNHRPAVIGSVIDRTLQVKEEKRIGRAVTEAQERERTHIGMELHDNVKQIMAASLMSLDFVKKMIDNKQRSVEIIDTVRGYITDAVKELRRLSHQLAPVAGDDDGTLVEKIEKLINDSKIADKMEVSLDLDEFSKPIDAEILLAFCRIMQEQFNNIIKYSKASGLLISVKEIAGKINMTIKDNGVGFDTTIKKEGIGLENIRRRIHTLNGDVKIISSPGEGCEVKVSVPLDWSAG